MKFFTSPADLNNWVLKQGDPNVAIQKILQVIGNNDALSVKDACNAIFGANKKEGKDVEISNEIEEAEGLYSVLAKYNLTEMTKTSEVNLMNKKIDKFSKTDFPIREAQVTRPPSSSYTGREDDNKYVGTPWRKDRDAIYDFTHRNPDMLSFDDDLGRVYSGEALWRRYIMDKFYRDYKDEKGRVVGGFINDRFKVFHDLGGNQMELANGERTRKPRPHQYSIERRLSEARGEKTEDILPLRAASGDVKIIITGSEDKPAKSSDIRYASSDDEYVEVPRKNIEDEEDDIAKAFVDILDMHEAGINDKEIILKISNHYKIPIAKVEQLKTFAYNKKNQARGILYACNTKKMSKFAGVSYLNEDSQMTTTDGSGNPVELKNMPRETPLINVGQDDRGNQIFKEFDAEIQQAVGEPLMFPQGVDPNAVTKDEGIDQTMEAMETGNFEAEIKERSDAESASPVDNMEMQEGEQELAASASNDFPIKEV